VHFVPFALILPWFNLKISFFLTAGIFPSQKNIFSCSNKNYRFKKKILRQRKIVVNQENIFLVPEIIFVGT